MRLFSYCIPVDDGAAPNPYWGICTLVICKPVIRRVADIGDWIVGLGGKNVDGIDYSGKVVYAMKITQKITMAEYDEYCRQSLPEKVPDIKHHDYKMRLGDCIYDFTTDKEGKLRQSVHNKGNRSTDIGGENALISDHFYYFGHNAIDLPEDLKPIVKQGQGHQSTRNESYKANFVNWIENLGYMLNSVNGDPQITLGFMQNVQDGEICASIRSRCAKEDEYLGEQETLC